MSGRGFAGGTHLDEAKEMTSGKPIEEMPLPPKVVIPLSQHFGAPAEPVVAVGDTVLTGQLIGKANGFISANIHASISGKVTKIAPYPHPLGYNDLSIFIESDHEDNRDTSLTAYESYLGLAPEKISSIAQAAGIVGLGGAAFPTSVKLAPPKDKKIDSLVINGAECEPFLTSDHRLMLEKGKEIVEGVKLMMMGLSVSRGIIGIEKNKPDAIEIFSSLAKGSGLEVVPLPTKYPQGGEKQLIKALLNREVPSGKLPMDVGVVVQNVGTAYALYDAVRYGHPLTKRVVTVSGSAINTPKNLLVRIGTPFSFVIEQCRGFVDVAERVIMGGPMMGVAQHTLDVSVIKGTSGILAFEPGFEDKSSQVCIRCGKCVRGCPMGIRPDLFGIYRELGMVDKAEGEHISDCIECGVCTYVCPSNRQNVQAIRTLKGEIRSKKAKSR